MKSILIIDDDKTFSGLLSGNLQKRGYETRYAFSADNALYIAEEFNPEWVVCDLKMPDSSGLELIPKLLEVDPSTRIVVLTGYASIATAVEAIKLGAVHYLTKPVTTDDIIAAFNKEGGDPTVAVEADTLPLNKAEREYILNALKRNNNNISATARELGLHRRTLQRKLDKIVK